MAWNGRYANNVPSKLQHFDVLLRHDPPGSVLEPGQNPIPIQVWVRKIPAYDPEEAIAKAMRFVLRSQVRNVTLKQWKYSEDVALPKPSNNGKIVIAKQ
jgi:hypothetical protein